MAKFRVTRPRCEGRGCYIDNRRVYTMQKACGRRLYPGERYCIHGPKARQFGKRDAMFYTPGWCPQLYKNLQIRIYEKAPDDYLEYLLKKNGEVFTIPIDARKYSLCATSNTPYTPLQFYKKLSSGLCDYMELLGRNPMQYDIIEINNGLTCAYLYLNKNYEWVQLYSFDKEKCENNMK